MSKKQLPRGTKPPQPTERTPRSSPLTADEIGFFLSHLAEARSAIDASLKALEKTEDRTIRFDGTGKLKNGVKLIAEFADGLRSAMRDKAFP